MRRLMRAACALALCLCLAGCQARSAVQLFDGLLQAAGRASLSPDFLLQGTRQLDSSGYTGSYTVHYEDFSGTETLLGGTTALNTHCITVACNAEASTGCLKVVLQRGTEEEVLLEGTGAYEADLTLESGSNYICAVGEGFTGILRLEVTPSKESAA